MCSVAGENPVVVEISLGRLTTVAFDIVCPTLEPSLSFVLHDVSAGFPFERVVVADETGSNGKVIATGHSPAWSPDGSQIVFSNLVCEYPCWGGLAVIDPLRGII